MDAPIDLELDAGAWLVEHRVGLDRGEAEWLERLARFDRDQLWSLDGHICCASWLVWRTSMARSTAFEKLRIAHEMDRRPIVAEAFRRGELSYSQVRIMTRMKEPDPEVDQAVVDLAASGQLSVLDLERLVRSFNLYAEQDQPLREDPAAARDVKIRRHHDGTGEIVITLADTELEEVAAALQAFIDLRYRPQPVDESPVADSDPDPGSPGGGPAAGAGPVDESPGGDTSSEAPLEEAGRAGRKADAFMDLIHTALAGADQGHAAGDDRYMVHLVTIDGGHSYRLLDGTPIHPVDAATIRCDCSTVTHTVTGDGEPLNLGRKTREWNTAQRRAITVRDSGHCRFPGCAARHYDIHHMQWWDDGGPTDIDNGFCQCRRHHRMLHAGYQVEGDPNGELRFYRPGGTYIGSTHPASPATLTAVRGLTARSVSLN